MTKDKKDLALVQKALSQNLDILLEPFADIAHGAEIATSHITHDDKERVIDYLLKKSNIAELSEFK